MGTQLEMTHELEGGILNLDSKQHFKGRIFRIHRASKQVGIKCLRANLASRPQDVCKEMNKSESFPFESFLCSLSF